MRPLNKPKGLLPAALLFLFAVLTAPTLAETRTSCKTHQPSCADLVYQGFTYPYDRPAGSYLYIDSGVYPYVTITENLLGDSTVRLPDNSIVRADALLKILDISPVSRGKLVPVIGYGSNPAPTQLARKFNANVVKPPVVIPVMKGTLRDFDVVWTPAFVPYGAMPATIAPSPGTKVDIWITWLDEETVKIMDGTEYALGTRRPLYALATLTNAEFEFDGPDPKSMLVYISCFGPLTVDGSTLAVRAVPAQGRIFRPVNAAEALESVLPALGWRKSVVELLFDNIVSPENRAKRGTALKAYGAFPDISGAEGLETCRASRIGPEDPY